MVKPQRIRDPIHDLIEFSTGDFDQFIWSLIQRPEFQRLRRIKQLGFSELVYPGASHSRFAHSVGVFNTARQLIERIKSHLGDEFDRGKADVSLTAALVHDLGHGPFSHAFEEAIDVLDKDKAKKEGKKPPDQKKHEIWTTDIIRGDTDIGDAIGKCGAEFRANVASLLKSEVPRNIYYAVVSSQFDADRLDYVRRDRLMTGVGHAGFDFSWILANLEVGSIPLATDEETYANVDSLVLGHKALQAAESYVVGLFHLYMSVYFHKATRSAEKMLSAIFRQLGRLCGEGAEDKSGLVSNNPMISFIKQRDLNSYLRLDDVVVAGSLSIMTEAKDDILRYLSARLSNRNLYKAIDITARFDGAGKEAAVARFRVDLAAARQEGQFGEIEIFEDTATRNPYKRKEYGSQAALEKIYIMPAAGGRPMDLRDRSDVVRVLEETSVYRIYVRDNEARAKIEKLIENHK